MKCYYESQCKDLKECKRGLIEMTIIYLVMNELIEMKIELFVLKNIHLF